MAYMDGHRRWYWLRVRSRFGGLGTIKYEYRCAQREARVHRMARKRRRGWA